MVLFIEYFQFCVFILDFQKRRVKDMEDSYKRELKIVQDEFDTER